MSQEETELNITLLPINEKTFWDRVAVDVSEEEVPPYGIFYLSFNNRCRQIHGLQTCYCQGTLYESGHVHLDTNELQRNNFETLTEMQEHLEQFGSYHISWLRGE
jgi:hypothetical protein